MPGLAAASLTIGGPGPFSLDSLTGHVLDRPWMRAAALAVIPAAIAAQIYRRRKSLADDTVAQASGTPVEEVSAQPHTPWPESTYWSRPTASLAFQRDRIEGNVASSHRQSIEDSDAGYPESGCGDDSEDDGCGGRIDWQEGPGSKAHQSRHTRPRSRSAYRLGRLNGLMISCHCHAVATAFLHEQASKRKIRTNRNPRSI